jgi:REP element-mobilizing transposase RayT
MSTHPAISYHIIFSTKNRALALKRERREDLFRYIWGIIKNRRSHLYHINGVEDHVHILSSLHPTVSLADFVKDIKFPVGFNLRLEGVAVDNSPLRRNL